MAKKKNTDRPKHVSIYYEQILYDLDFMSNEYAGIILKMIVWYSSDTPEGKQRIEEMKQYIDTLPDKGWLTSLYKRLFDCIDKDFVAYAAHCEKQRKRIQDYWDRKKSEVNDRIPRNTTEYNGIPMNSIYDNDNDNDNDNDSPNGDNKNINITSSSSSNAGACEESGLVKSKLWEWQNADIVTKQDIPQLTDVWIEEVKRLVERFTKEKITSEDIAQHYEDFCAQEATEVLQESYAEWRRHFNNYVRKRIMEEQKNGTTGKKQAISRDEQRRLEAEERKESAARLVAKYLSKSAGSA